MSRLAKIVSLFHTSPREEGHPISAIPSFGGVRGGLVLLLFLSLVGCRPHGVLSSKQMRSVLYDLHRADAILQAAGYNYGHDEDVAKYYQAVMDKHGVTQAQFDSSLVWYTNNPQLFDKIYPRVVKELEADRDAWQAQHDETQRLIGLELQEKWNREAAAAQQKTVEELLSEYANGLSVLYFLDSISPSLFPDTLPIVVLYLSLSDTMPVQASPQEVDTLPSAPKRIGTIPSRLIPAR